MSERKIAGRSPSIQEMEPGVYYWCQCGRSANQPFCDGSHKETEFAPVEFRLEASRRVALCTCKQTGREPFCDGTHKRL